MFGRQVTSIPTAKLSLLNVLQDREAEPRFGPPGGGAARGGFGGGMAPGGYAGGGPGGGFNPGMAGGGGRQIYVSNVCSLFPP